MTSPKTTAMLRTLLFLLVLPCVLSGQTESIKSLERDVNQSTGSKLITSSFDLAEIYFENGRYDDGVKVLEKAAREAQKGRHSAQIAQVNKSRAEYLLLYTPNIKKYNQEILEALKKSLDQKTASLMEPNLSILYQLQARNSDAGLGGKIRDLIGDIEQSKSSLVLEEERKRDEEEFKKFRKMAEGEKFEDFKNLTEERVKLDSVVEKLAHQTENLNRLNQKRKLEIVQLSQEKAASELILERNLRRMDSLSFVNYRDSMVNVENRRIIETQQAELERRQSEITLSKTKNTLFLTLASLVFLVSLFLFMRYRSSQKHNFALAAKNEIIEIEKNKSDRLLLNILPSKVADELKEEGKVRTQFFESATVMFADFYKFSRIASSVSPEVLIKDLDYCFSKFDEIVESLGIEKIKTIGDAYMCVAGVPNPVQDHAARMIQAGKEIQAFLEIWNASRRQDDLPEFKARIGIHSGPLIAGVVGTSKFAYDIWGETVNIADRMQDSGEPGEINISKATQSLLGGNYKLEYRGKLTIKNMADMEGYFVRL